jgi:hypothetical protein
MENYQITSRNRHKRIMYFVDENYDYEKIFSLINENQSMWGGRYNPIVLVKENTISENWIEVIKFYDPDFIYYSNEVDPDIIKKLRLFNPCGYFNLDEPPETSDMRGLDSFHFLSELHHKSKIILTTGLENDNPLINYYQVNYGLRISFYEIQTRLSSHLDRKIVDMSEFDKLHELIYTLNPVNQSHLSRKNINTKILRSDPLGDTTQSELVVAKGSGTKEDLLYYWNRMLFEIGDIKYITESELELLCEDEYFGKTLEDFSYQNNIIIISQSLSEEEINSSVVTKLKKSSNQIRYRFQDIAKFPYNVLDSNGLFERNYGESDINQALNSSEGLYQIPNLTFTKKPNYSEQKWATDIKIKSLGSTNKPEIHLPSTTDAQLFFNSLKGRINKKNEISIFIDNHTIPSDSIKITIPRIDNYLYQLLSRPFINGTSTENGYYSYRLHDDSRKLLAFLKLFNLSFHTIEEFLTDKFWVGIFDELILSQKQVGNAISFSDLLMKCKKILAEEGKVELDEYEVIKGKKGETYKNEENLILGLQDTLEELCEYHIFFKGYTFKCPNCSSNFWYSINEVDEYIDCKGCTEEFVFPVESSLSYKLNEVVKNNTYQSQTQRDGNLTVIRTLCYLEQQSRYSFEYKPQINIFDKPHTNAPINEIDIVCISDGKLIIGEAKHNSKAFSEDGYKSLKSLVEASKKIRPYKVILSCYENERSKLENAEKKLIYLFNSWEYQPEIEILELHSPDYFSLGDHKYFRY